MISRLGLVLGAVLCAGAAVLGCAGSQAAGARSGSMARFVVHDGFLYALDRNELRVYRVADSQSPRLVSEVPVDAWAETMFPVDDILYLGTRQGMLIYSLERPHEPEPRGRAEHLYSCDPVVVQDEIAYVTLRSDGNCRTGENQLLIFDVSDPREPQQIVSVPMSNPHGLAVSGDLLFVTDGVDGLVVLDVSNPASPRLLDTTHMDGGYDAIADEARLYVSAADGLYQYHYEYDIELILEQLSQVPIGEQPSPVPHGVKYETTGEED